MAKKTVDENCLAGRIATKTRMLAGEKELANIVKSALCKRDVLGSFLLEKKSVACPPLWAN